MSGNAPHPEQGTDQVPPQREVAKEPANLSQQTWQSMQPVQPMQLLNQGTNDRLGTPGIMQGEMMKYGGDSDKPLPLAFKPQGESGGPLPLAFKPNSDNGTGRPMYMADGRIAAPGLVLVGESGHDKMPGNRGFGMARQESGSGAEPEKTKVTQPEAGQPKADQTKATQPEAVQPGADKERSESVIRGPIKPEKQNPEMSEKEKAQLDLKTKVMDHNTPSEKRLEAVRELVKQGVTSIPITDDKGNKANLRMEVVKAGSSEMVHAFVNSGKQEKTALRGTVTESGAMIHQQGKHGQVSMEGRGIRQLNQMHMADSQASTQQKAPTENVLDGKKLLFRGPREDRQSQDSQPAAQRQEAAPKRQETAPVKQETAPVKQETAPVKQETAPVKQETAPKRQESAPKRQEAAPVRQDPAEEDQPKIKKQPQATEDQPREQPGVQKVIERKTEGEVTRPTNREKMEVPNQGDRTERNGNERIVRDISDRSKFYAHQDDGVSCSAYSMAMMHSDHKTGRPVSYGRESQSFKELAGTIGRGYRGNLQSIADKMEKTGLDAKAYEYKRFGDQGMKDLNAELDRGHTAIARVINPHTGNNHYIYVAGRDQKGNYIVGDPDRANKQHNVPVTPGALMKMMSGRDGFVAGWNANANRVPEIPGTAGYQMYRKPR